MCGRFAQFSDPEALAQRLEAELVGQPPAPRYNIAPGGPVLACRTRPDGCRELRPLHWGLIPSWAKDRRTGYRMINARAETAAEKPAFRAAFRARRCLVPADGFYEWQASAHGKQPWYFTRHDGDPLCFAGLWEHWTDPEGGEQVESTTILVTSANARVGQVHDRMPVILEPEAQARWLDPRLQARAPLQGLLRPCADALLRAHPVCRRVNRPGEDDPALIRPILLED